MGRRTGRVLGTWAWLHNQSSKQRGKWSSSGLTGAVTQFIWAQQLLTSTGGSITAYWEGENTEAGSCWGGAPFFTLSSFPTACGYSEAPYIVVLQVPGSVPNENKEGKNQWPFLSLWLFQRNSMSDPSGLCKHGRWMCVYFPPAQSHTMSHNSFVVVLFREFVKQNSPS